MITQRKLRWFPKWRIFKIKRVRIHQSKIQFKSQLHSNAFIKKRLISIIIQSANTSVEPIIHPEPSQPTETRNLGFKTSTFPLISRFARLSNFQSIRRFRARLRRDTKRRSTLINHLTLKPHVCVLYALYMFYVSFSILLYGVEAIEAANIAQKYLRSTPMPISPFREKGFSNLYFSNSGFHSFIFL